MSVAVLYKHCTVYTQQMHSIKATAAYVAGAICHPASRIGKPDPQHVPIRLHLQPCKVWTLRNVILHVPTWGIVSFNKSVLKDHHIEELFRITLPLATKASKG